MSFVDIMTVKSLYATLSHEDVGDLLRCDIEKNRRAYRVTEQIKLPQLIREPEHVYAFFMSEVEPNFITLGSATKEVVVEENLQSADLHDKIVMIRSADPGYDWVFSRDIGGLITMYGGANSHMAIRCAELGIPAVIGCGEKNFESWSSGSVLQVDCGNRQVRIVK